MTSQKLILCLGVVLSLVMPRTTCRAEEPAPGEPVNGLQALLATRHITVRPGGELSLELKLRNVSQQPLSIYRQVSTVMATTAYVMFHVRREDGIALEILQAIDEHGLPDPKDFVRLAPGAEFSVPITITAEEFGWGRPGMIASGHYEITLDVIFSDEGRAVGVKDAWSGTLMSAPVSFEIIP